MVRVAPVEGFAVDIAARQDRGRLFRARTVALPWLRRENGDFLQDAHRGQTDHQHLAGVAAGSEHVVLVWRATRGVGHQGGTDVVLAQAALGCNLEWIAIQVGRRCAAARASLVRTGQLRNACAQ
jgi:hypothetical protein